MKMPTDKELVSAMKAAIAAGTCTVPLGEFAHLQLEARGVVGTRSKRKGGFARAFGYLSLPKEPGVDPKYECSWAEAWKLSPGGAMQKSLADVKEIALYVIDWVALQRELEVERAMLETDGVHNQQEPDWDNIPF